MAGPSQVLQAKSFGAMLRLLRRRAQLTQMELGIQVGYSEAHISRLEGGQRTPDPVIVATRFVPALMLDDQPEVAARFVELADQASGGTLTSLHYTTSAVAEIEQLEEVGALELIPAPPSNEITRADALGRLTLLLETQGAAALIGMPGIGKTTLASKWARQQREPVFWLTFGPAINPMLDTLTRQLALFLLLEGQQQVSFLLGSSTPAPTPDQQVNIIAAALAETGGLLCLDDIHELKDEAAWDALSRWKQVEGVQFLFISREEIPGLGVPEVHLIGLELEESQELMLAMSADLAPELARKVHSITAGNPMLIRLALGQIIATDTPAGQYLDDLALEPAVSAYILDAMLKDLHPGTKELLTWLSLFRHPIDLYQPGAGTCLREILPEPEASAAALDEARRRQFIDRPTQAVLHPLIGSHIRHHLVTDPERRHRLHMLAAECCMTGSTADSIEVAYHLVQAREFESAVDWLTDQVGELSNRGLNAGAAQIIDEILVDSSGPATDKVVRRRLLGLRGDLLVNTTRADEAEQDYRDALDLSPRTEVGPVAWAQLALRLANCLMQRTKVQESAELLQDALSVLGEGSPLIRVQLAASMARAQLMTTQLDSAEQSAREALSIVKEVERFAPLAAAEASASAHSMLGIILRIRRDYSGSIEHWKQAIRDARRAGKLDLEYRSMVNLGGSYYEQGDLEQALLVCEEARTGLTAIGDSYALARVLNTISILHHVRGELGPSLERAEQASELKQLIGDKQGWANSEALRGLLLLNLGRIEEGLQTLQAVVEATRDTGEQRAQAIYLDSLGFAQILSGAAELGESTLTGAMKLEGVEDDNRLRGNLENHLAQAYLTQGEIEKAKKISDSPTPDGAGPEVDVERGMVRMMAELAAGEVSAARELGRQVASQAEQGGFTLHKLLIQQLMDLDPAEIPQAELPARGWVLQESREETKQG